MQKSRGMSRGYRHRVAMRKPRVPFSQGARNKHSPTQGFSSRLAGKECVDFSEERVRSGKGKALKFKGWVH